MVLGVASLLISLMLVRGAGLEIIGNPSIAPPGRLGVVVNKRRAFLPAKVGRGAAHASWSFRLLVVSPLEAPDRSLGASREQQL